MKKLTSLFLAVIMVVSMMTFVQFGSSAAEGTAITTAEQFAAMEAGGTYYLANDITVSETYAATFTGAFDGNGKTITTSVPLFADFSGSLKNLTVNGDIKVEGVHNSAISQATSGTMVVDNVVINANLTGGKAVGGVVGNSVDGAVITITNVTMNGNITDGGNQVGAIVGYCPGPQLTVDKCINNGTIGVTDPASDSLKNNYGGGIVGRFGKDASTADYVCKITNCVNNGNFTGVKDQSGGIIGYVVGMIEIDSCINRGNISSIKRYAAGVLGSAAAKVVGITISNCYNYGEITGIRRAGGIAACLGTGAAATSYQVKNCGNYGKITCSTDASNDLCAAGIAGYMYGGSTENGVFDSFNVGDIHAKDPNKSTKTVYVAGIVAYFNTSTAYVKNCFNTGKLTAEPAANLQVNQVYYNKHADGAVADYVANNYALSVDGAVYEVNGVQAPSVTAASAADFASGAVAYAMNSAAGKTVYYQTLGTDAAPTNQTSAKAVFKVGSGYANEISAPTTSAPVITPSTADTALTLVFVAAAAIAVTLSLRKKRQG